MIFTVLMFLMSPCWGGLAIIWLNNNKKSRTSENSGGGPRTSLKHEGAVSVCVAEPNCVTQSETGNNGGEIGINRNLLLSHFSLVSVREPWPSYGRVILAVIVSSLLFPALTCQNPLGQIHERQQHAVTKNLQMFGGSECSLLFDLTLEWLCPLHIPPTQPVAEKPWTPPSPMPIFLIGHIETPIASVDAALKVMFYFTRCQDAFAVVTLHSADVTNPSVVPQEPRH